jgi:Tfp pilus assembly protein PilF
LALKGDLTAARALAEPYAKQDPDAAEWLIVLAQLASAAGDAESAARYVRLAAQRAPDNPALALALRD